MLIPGPPTLGKLTLLIPPTLEKLTLLIPLQVTARVRLPLLKVWPGAAIRVVAALQVVYLSARLGFTLRDDTISYVMKP